MINRLIPKTIFSETRRERNSIFLYMNDEYNIIYDWTYKRLLIDSFLPSWNQMSSVCHQNCYMQYSSLRNHFIKISFYDKITISI